MKKYFLLVMTLMLLLLSGCSSLETAIKKRNLATETKLSETIWLSPENIMDKTVFVQVKILQQVTWIWKAKLKIL